MPTSLTAEYMRVGGNDERVAAIVYAGVMACMGLTFGSLWRYATTNRRLITAHLTDADVRRSTRRFTVGGPIYLLAMLVGLVSAAASVAVVGALAIYYLMPAGGAIPHPVETEQSTDDGVR